MGDIEFAAVDVETTGLFAKGTDRIVEIAIFRLTSRGEPLDRYETLVNPNRDVGPTHIHGITARDVDGAPTFQEIVGDVLARLAGAVLVGHNVEFDYRFFSAEFLRAGIQLPECARVCTMRLASRIAPTLTSRKLGAVCQGLNIDHGTAHSAAADAAAAGRILALFLERTPVRAASDLGLLDPSGDWIPKEHWPSLAPSGRTRTRHGSAALSATRRSYIADLVERLPAVVHSNPSVDNYQALLDRIFEDRRVTSDEQAMLELLCREVGLSRDQAIHANREYLRDLIHVALSDGIITQPEVLDLLEVARLLGVDTLDYEHMVREAEVGYRRGARRDSYTRRASQEVAGKSVCFTGELVLCIDGERVTREQVHEIATRHGMEVRDRVTKDLDILVGADPYSLSSKAKKAHQYGIRVVSAAVFFQMLGIQVE